MEPRPLQVRFFQTTSGREPVREWLKQLGRPDSQSIGEDIATVQNGWPVGMPVCRPLGDGLYEVRSSLPGGRIARVLFFFASGKLVLTHGFIKKSQKTPESNMRLARERMQEFLAKEERRRQ